jgi:hypothetical protein
MNVSTAQKTSKDFTKLTKSGSLSFGARFSTLKEQKRMLFLLLDTLFFSFVLAFVSGSRPTPYLVGLSDCFQSEKLNGCLVLLLAWDLELPALTLPLSLQ